MLNDNRVIETISQLVDSDLTENLVQNLWIDKKTPGILFVTSYPPRECGIATYSNDLIKTLKSKFGKTFNINICALETENEIHDYNSDVKYRLNTDHPSEFTRLAKIINEDTSCSIILIQHEFGFYAKAEPEFLAFLRLLHKPVVVVFHTILPGPNENLKENVRQIANASKYIVVMTKNSGFLLMQDYGIAENKIVQIAHGTHLVSYLDKDILKAKHQLTGKKVLATFGLLNSGKSIETTLDALPEMVMKHPEIMFLIIGKTHPGVVAQEGEKYREFLQEKIETLHLEEHVQFINAFLPTSELLEYLQLTDIYLFTSKDPNQAVSGTFSYALSCGCPIISTPIPHAVEVLKKDAGRIFDFGHSGQLAKATIELLDDHSVRHDISLSGLHTMASTAWENAAIAHAVLFEKITNGNMALKYSLPAINLDHLKKMTTDFGMIQFSKINHPDLESGYTIDDNARAMIAFCQHYEQTSDAADLPYINSYLNYITFCQQPDGRFLNYVDTSREFTDQNHAENLEDSNGRAIWALGYLIQANAILPIEFISNAVYTLEKALPAMVNTHSTRAMAFAIKGLYYYNNVEHSDHSLALIRLLADRLVQMYRHESDAEWHWFESYLTYANGILPEALLCAWQATGNPVYKESAKTAFDFLLSKTFKNSHIQVVSNKTWMHKADPNLPYVAGGEQPIDVAYTIFALSRFYNVFNEVGYKRKLHNSFNWFLGSNHLHQIIYNPKTGGCYDGLEANNVNLNQGAESSVSYLMARLTVEKFNKQERKIMKKRKPAIIPTANLPVLYSSAGLKYIGMEAFSGNL